jgi:hypothetical protein
MEQGRKRQVGPSGVRVAMLVVVLVAALGAGIPPVVRVDDWQTRPSGRLELGPRWRTYPFYERADFKQPPAIAVEDGRHALGLFTDGEAVRIGRPLQVDVRRTPWLVWDWKPLALPAGGDVRDRRRNDQAARIMVVFEGMKAVAYVWDSSAPVGTEVLPDELEIFQRLLVVVRSGDGAVGQWHRERRNLLDDYRHAFGEEPRSAKWVGFESHSNDTRTRSAVLFGAASFEP